MSGRDAILSGVRNAVHQRAAVERRREHPGPYPAPGAPSDWATFAERLRSVGGEPYGPVSADELGDTLRRLCRAWAGGRRVVLSHSLAEHASGFETAGAGTPPAGLADVEVAVVRGSLGIAENGAVAIGGSEARPRALLFLCQRLVLVLDQGALVSDMHRAIDAMPSDALDYHHYTWISGPSKTADIEQTLVLGAHGPKALCVIGVAQRKTSRE